MTTDAQAKQAAYAAKRQAHTGARQMEPRTYRVTLPDGTQIEERCIGLSQVAAQWPQAVRVEWLKNERGAFLVMPKYTPNPEHALQASVVAFFKAHLPADMPWSSADHGFAFRGDAIQRINAWNRLAARGVAKGLPDMPVIFYRGRLHCIEFKAPGGKPTDEQLAWGAKIVAQGGTFDICESRAEVWESMCRAFGDDNPLRPPLALLQLWLAKDDVAPVKRVVRARKATTAKPTRTQLARVAKLRAGRMF